MPSTHRAKESSRDGAYRYKRETRAVTIYAGCSVELEPGSSQHRRTSPLVRLSSRRADGQRCLHFRARQQAEVISIETLVSPDKMPQFLSTLTMDLNQLRLSPLAIVPDEVGLQGAISFEFPPNPQGMNWFHRSD